MDTHNVHLGRALREKYESETVDEKPSGEVNRMETLIAERYEFH